jgi:hypothetical protein
MHSLVGRGFKKVCTGLDSIYIYFISVKQVYVWCIPTGVKSSGFGRQCGLVFVWPLGWDCNTKKSQKNGFRHANVPYKHPT